MYLEIEEQDVQLLDLYICYAVFIVMAPQANLAKVALEGFDMIDAFSGRARKPARKNCVHKGCAPKQEPVINSEEAAKRFGGIVITERFVGKGNRGYVPL